MDLFRGGSTVSTFIPGSKAYRIYIRVYASRQSFLRTLTCWASFGIAEQMVTTLDSDMVNLKLNTEHFAKLVLKGCTHVQYDNVPNVTLQVMQYT